MIYDYFLKKNKEPCIYNALDVTNYIISIDSINMNRTNITNMYISKEELLYILYMIQQIYMCNFLRPFFKEDIYVDNTGIIIEDLNDKLELMLKYDINDDFNKYADIFDDREKAYIKSIYKTVLADPIDKLYDSFFNSLLYKISYKKINEVNLIPKELMRDCIVFHNALIFIGQLMEASFLC